MSLGDSGRPSGVRGGSWRALAERGGAHRVGRWQLALTSASFQSRRELSALPHADTHRVREVRRERRTWRGEACGAGSAAPLGARWGGRCAAPAGRGGAAIGSRCEPILARSRHLQTGRDG